MIRPVTMVSGVLVVLVLLLAPYLRPWVNQRSQISDAQAQVRGLQQQVQELTAEKQRWEDPAYVRAQARQRLHLVLPGEIGYVALDDRPAPAAPVDPRTASAALPAGTSGQPWFAQVWSSLQLAGGQSVPPARPVSGQP